MLKIDLTATPPTQDVLEAERQHIAVLQRRWLLRLIPLVVGMVPVVWLTRDSFMGGGLAGFGFALSLGAVAVFLMRFSFERELLSPVTPLQCLPLETAKREPVVASYLGALQHQGRELTRLEAGEIRRYARKTIELVDHERAVEAWRAVHGTGVEKPAA
jgi:hypothetical protein